jgi:hypothetical protein
MLKTVINKSEIMNTDGNENSESPDIQRYNKKAAKT